MAVQPITIEEVRKVIQEELEPFAKKVEEHDKYLIRGNGQPSMLEDMRTVKGYQAEQKTWLKAIALFFISQFVAVMSGLVYLLIQVAPILKNLAEIPLK